MASGDRTLPTSHFENFNGLSSFYQEAISKMPNSSFERHKVAEEGDADKKIEALIQRYLCNRNRTAPVMIRQTDS
jgi:menaquinone-dependent protoporphyrinogen IX oxidase